MPFDPHTHNRKSIRLPQYDYSQPGLYFITICCANMDSRFGKIINGEMIYNIYGQIAFAQWLKLAERFQYFELDVFQIMPNHMHAIIRLNDAVGAGLAPARIPPIISLGQPANFAVGAGLAPAHITLVNDDPQDHRMGHPADDRAGASPAPTTSQFPISMPVGDIIGAYKSLVANECLNIFKTNNETMGKIWQRNFYEHVIRNENSYQNIAAYIINNPANWAADKFYNE